MIEEEDEVFLKILMPAGRIPLESRVTKVRGAKPYTIRDRIRVFGEGGDRREIVAQQGARFVVAENGDANAIGDDVELVWYAAHWLVRDLVEPCD